MKTREFHLGCVLSVILQRNLSLYGFEAIEDILSFMVPWSEDCNERYSVARAYLLKKFPELNSPEIEVARNQLHKTLQDGAGICHSADTLLTWLSDLVGGHHGFQLPGRFEVEQLPNPNKKMPRPKCRSFLRKRGRLRMPR